MCDNVFKVAAQAYWSKDNFASSENHTLADTINEFFREGFSEDIYSIMSWWNQLLVKKIVLLPRVEE